MPLIEKIGQMQEQGLKEDEIAQRLLEEGISPLEINEALDQSKVKSAVSKNKNEAEPSLMYSTKKIDEPIVIPEYTQPQQTVQQTRVPQEMPSTTRPRTEEARYMQPPTQIGAYPEEAPSEEAAYPVPQYGEQSEEYPEYQYSIPPLDTGMITEIAEQIIDEKTENLQKQISETSKFKTEIQGRVNSIDDRIRRIEMIIDRLQISILKSVGEYGKDISDLKKEMIATQDSFSKILNPLSENIKELRKITDSATKTTLKKPTEKKIENKEAKEEATKKTKATDGFEGYMRE